MKGEIRRRRRRRRISQVIRKSICHVTLPKKLGKINGALQNHKWVKREGPKSFVLK